MQTGWKQADYYALEYVSIDSSGSGIFGRICH